MNETERAEAIGRLKESRDVFLASTVGLNDAQWDFRPVPGRWSIAECVEHVALGEDLLFGLLSAEVPPMETPPDTSMMESMIYQHGAERTRKIESPDAGRPTGRFGSGAQALEAFRASRERTLAYIARCTADLRSRPALHPHPLIGQTTGQICLALLTVHPARHAKQIEEVKAEPGFPK